MEELWGGMAMQARGLGGAVEGEGDHEGAQQDARVHSQGACKLQAQQTAACNVRGTDSPADEQAGTDTRQLRQSSPDLAMAPECRSKSCRVMGTGNSRVTGHGPQQARTERRKTAQSCSSPECAAAGNAAVPPRQRQKWLPAHPIWATGRQGIANATDGKLPPASAEWAGSAILKISKVTRNFLFIFDKTKSKSRR